MLLDTFHLFILNVLLAQIKFSLRGCLKLAPFLEIIGNWPLKFLTLSGTVIDRSAFNN